MLPTREFCIPRRVVIGSGSSAQVGEECQKLGVKKSLIVTDQVMVKLGILEGIEKALEQNKMQFAVYDGVATEPTTDYVEEGLRPYKENKCDFVLTIGGGSPIDTAKAISIMVTNPGSLQNYMGLGKVPTLLELGLDRAKLDKLAPKMTEAAIASGSPGNNPRQATKEEVIELYKLAYQA